MIELTTQCPQCQHQFDVTLEQLQQRKGLLRCPQCAQIFDAYECAVANATAKATEILPEAIPTLIKTRAQTATAMRSTQPIQSARENEDDIRVYLNQEGRPEPQFESSLNDELIGIRAEPRRVITPSALEPGPDTSGRRVVWAVIVWVLLLVTVGQLLYVYRSQIANTVGFTRPILQYMCNSLGCTIPYMREVEAIEIRQSTLQQQPNFEQNGQYAYTLQLQLKNTLPWAQEWPTLVVSFSDASAAALATLAIAPLDYLAPSQRDKPFDPGAQITIRLPVLLPNKKINGFTVEKYYP